MGPLPWMMEEGGCLCWRVMSCDVVLDFSILILGVAAVVVIVRVDGVVIVRGGGVVIVRGAW